jgi:hypothetical protein
MARGYKKAKRGGGKRRSSRRVVRAANPIGVPGRRRRRSLAPRRAMKAAPVRYVRRRNPVGLAGNPAVRYAGAAIAGAVAGTMLNAKAAEDPAAMMGLGQKAIDWGVQPATVAGGVTVAIAWKFYKGPYRGELLAFGLGMAVPEAIDRFGALGSGIGGKTAALTAGSRADLKRRIAEKRAARAGNGNGNVTQIGGKPAASKNLA